MLDEVLVAGGAALLADAAPRLGTEFGKGCTLDISEMGYGDHHVLVGIEIFRIELVGAHGDLAAAGVAVLGLHLLALVLNYLELEGVAAEDLDAAGDELLEFVIFGLELLALESGELAETHLDDGLSLGLGEAELGDEPLAGLVHALGGADVGDYLVDDIDSLEQTFQDVGTLLGLVEIELRAAHHYLVTEIDEVRDDFLEGKGAGTALDQGDVVDGETRLQRSVLEEGVEHHVGVGALLDTEDDADTLAGSLIIHIGDALYLLVFHHRGDAFEHLLLVHHIRYLGNDYGLLAAVVDFDVGLGADDHTATAGGVGVDDALAAHDEASRREVRALDILHQTLDVDVRIVDIGADGIAALAEIVGSHIGSHTYGDTGGAVEQQQRQLGRKHGRLFDGIVEVERHIDRVLFYIGDDILRHLLKLGLGISHSSDGVTVHATEVSLTIYQRIALVPILGETRHCVIDGTVPMRMELTQDLTHDTG